MKTIGIIPTRFQSIRFPGKPLALLEDKPMIQWVYEGVLQSQLFDTILIATDHDQIAETARSFGAEVVMTSSEHPSGTDRIREALETYEAQTGQEWDLVVNIQGDEPLIEKEQLEPLIQLFQNNPEAQIGTLCTPIHDLRELESPNVVKVVTGQEGQGLYFSRSPIPFFRDRAGLPKALAAGLFQKHIGLYAFRPPILKQTAFLAISSLERAESLEQLRWLQSGMRIFVAQTNHTTIGVDTPEDLDRAAQLIKEKRS